jgi:hypothetical protein
LADVTDADLMHPVVAEVVGVGDDGLARLQHIAEADLRRLLPRCSPPVLVVGQAIGAAVDNELPDVREVNP